ncbi:MAG: anti-sigma factor family protein [Acidobacteriota bacterium]
MKCDEIEVCLSGYLDLELPQQQSQRVRVHLESCAKCGKLLKELEEVKTKTKSLSYRKPSGGEWIQMEQHIFQKMSRRLGWMVLIIWSVVTAAYAGYQYASAPTEPLFEKLLAFGLLLGVALLFLSVLSERLRTRKTDRYREIQR